MSYLTQAQDPKRRVAALTGTLAVHVALGFAIVTGLTIAGAGPLDDGWDPFTITPEAKPTPPPVEQQQEESADNSVVTAPPQPFDLTRSDSTATVEDPVEDDVVRIPDPPVARPDPPRPVASFVPKRASPSNNPNRWITTDDYPGGPLRSEVEGVAGYSVTVGINGRVSRCEVTRTSGNSHLDGATCRFITQRARFDPATDETGAKVIGTFTGSVVWEIPD